MEEVINEGGVAVPISQERVGSWELYSRVGAPTSLRKCR